MQRRTRWITVGIMAAGIALASATATVADDGGVQRLEVSITNVTRGQILSPAVVIVHDGSYKLFVPGEPASPELAQLAEDAVAGPLIALLGTLPEVFDVGQAAGVILPGETATVEVEARGASRHVTVAAMLVTTNDAFIAGGGEAGAKASAVAALAYDAGSEGNTESCDHIPGPPCGNPLVRVTDTAEGFVHVHAGIHGTGDLASYEHDWRNPAAVIRIARID